MKNFMSKDVKIKTAPFSQLDKAPTFLVSIIISFADNSRHT